MQESLIHFLTEDAFCASMNSSFNEKETIIMVLLALKDSTETKAQIHLSSLPSEGKMSLQNRKTKPNQNRTIGREGKKRGGTLIN